jgi:hypothetical protein
VILHEVVHELRHSGMRGVLFKIDFEKTYDKIRWDFVKCWRRKASPRSGFIKL